MRQLHCWRDLFREPFYEVACSLLQTGTTALYSAFDRSVGQNVYTYTSSLHTTGCRPVVNSTWVACCLLVLLRRFFILAAETVPRQSRLLSAHRQACWHCHSMSHTNYRDCCLLPMINCLQNPSGIATAAAVAMARSSVIFSFAMCEIDCLLTVFYSPLSFLPEKWAYYRGLSVKWTAVTFVMQLLYDYKRSSNINIALLEHMCSSCRSILKEPCIAGSRAQMRCYVLEYFFYGGIKVNFPLRIVH